MCPYRHLLHKIAAESWVRYNRRLKLCRIWHFSVILKFNSELWMEIRDGGDRGHVCNWCQMMLSSNLGFSGDWRWWWSVAICPLTVSEFQNSKIPRRVYNSLPSIHWIFMRCTVSVLNDIISRTPIWIIPPLTSFRPRLLTGKRYLNSIWTRSCTK